ncbi:MAG: hypothetical protein HYU85_07915 [Chloroflexi bacterium]|nr:hypothetical protein [Chloroflexota bacterium]MBI3930604.1 hypothetical protein [Chloroflexota bacterium]
MGRFLIGAGATEGEAGEKLAEEQRKAEESGLHPEHRPITFRDWHHRQWVSADYATNDA